MQAFLCASDSEQPPPEKPVATEQVVAEKRPQRVLTEGLSVSTNPSTVNILPGTGELGQFIFRRGEDFAIRIGGIWVADGDVVLTGGTDKGPWSGNNLIVIGLDADLNKVCHWKGGSFGIAFLQFNGMDSNAQQVQCKGLILCL